MAPELFDINDQSQSNPPTPESDVPPSGVVTTEARNIRQSGRSTRESDMFALGMVTIEVRNVYRGGFCQDFETPRAFIQVFTGQVPFPEIKTPPMVMKSIIDGKRPSRPSRGKKLGLSDELWEVIQSSLAPRAEERCPVSTFVDFLEKGTPNITVLKELAEFNANSQEHVQKLRLMFECKDNTLLGMREETATIIEVFDRVSPRPSPPFHTSRTCLT